MVKLASELLSIIDIFAHEYINFVLPSFGATFHTATLKLNVIILSKYEIPV